MGRDGLRERETAGTDGPPWEREVPCPWHSLTPTHTPAWAHWGRGRGGAQEPPLIPVFTGLGGRGNCGGISHKSFPLIFASFQLSAHVPQVRGGGKSLGGAPRS